MPTSRMRWIVLLALVVGGPASAQCDDAQTLTADLPAEAAEFGASVAADGAWLVVGAPESSIALEKEGTAYVFQRQDGDWNLFEVLTPDDAADFDDFGRAVAVDDQTIVVGAPGKDFEGDNEGAAYAFRFDGDQWVQQQRLTAEAAESGDRFGWSVAIDGDAIAVGAFGVDQAANSAGAVYPFRLVDSAWEPEGVLLAEDAAALAQLGRSVAIDGDRILAGAWQDDDFGFFTGAAYAFTYDGDQWTQEQKLLADDAAEFSWFGIDVDLQANQAIVGAYGDEEAGGDEAGAAYVFEFDDGQWQQQTKLLADDGAANARFGWSVAIDGVDAWVGATGDSGADAGAGAAYLFRFNVADWQQALKFATDDGGAGAELGTSIDAIPGAAVAGAPFWDVNVTLTAGAAVALAGCVCPADFNADGLVNVLDFVSFQQAWMADNPAADCDDSGEFDVVDFVCFSELFAEGCP